MPPDDFIVLTRGTCDELSENHAKGIIYSLKGIERVENGIREIKQAQAAHDSKITGMENTLRSIDTHIRGVTDWQAKRETMEEEARKAAKAKRKFWEPIKNTAITTVVKWSVGGIVLLLGSALGGGLIAWAKSKLAGP